MSALRPPKMTKLAVIQAMNSRYREAGAPVDNRRRVRSLTHHSSSPPQRHDPPRRSLHNLHISHRQPSWSVEEELKKRRRLAGFDQSYGETKKSDSDSDPECEEGTETDEREWEQVSGSEDSGT